MRRSTLPLRDGFGSARSLRGPTPIILALVIQLSLAGTVLCAALTQEGATSQEDSQTSALIPVPPATHIDTSSFVLEDLAGAHHELAMTRADIVLVHFFATWCEPCREELPALQRLVARSDASDISVLVVSVGEPDDRVRRACRFCWIGIARSPKSGAFRPCPARSCLIVNWSLVSW